MTRRLGDSDRRAVDLLLDRSAGGGDGNGNGGYISHAAPATEPGIAGVQRLLNLLDLMPAEEPPADLIARTIGRIDAHDVAMHPAPPAMMTNRPHA